MCACACTCVCTCVCVYTCVPVCTRVYLRVLVCVCESITRQKLERRQGPSNSYSHTVTTPQPLPHLLLASSMRRTTEARTITVRKWIQTTMQAYEAAVLLLLLSTLAIAASADSQSSTELERTARAQAITCELFDSTAGKLCSREAMKRKKRERERKQAGWNSDLAHP